MIRVLTHSEASTGSLSRMIGDALRVPVFVSEDLPLRRPDSEHAPIELRELEQR